MGDTMKPDTIFMRIDLTDWVYRTIEKVQRGSQWQDAWQKTYRELGGASDAVMTKGCPMKGTQTLYELGRIKDSGKNRKNLPLAEIRNGYSKNGVYAVLALDELQSNSDISAPDLWKRIQERVRNDLGEEPAASNQGGPTVAFKLWHAGLVG